MITTATSSLLKANILQENVCDVFTGDLDMATKMYRLYRWFSTLEAVREFAFENDAAYFLNLT